MRLSFAILIILGLSSCEILGPDEGRLEVRTDRQEYALKSVASVTIRNGTIRDLLIQPVQCFWLLEEKTSTGWQVVDRPFCPGAIILQETLKAGDEIIVELRVDPGVSVTTYRYRFFVTEARGKPLDATSNSFVIVEDTRNAG